jgi:hypothetical protein
VIVPLTLSLAGELTTDGLLRTKERNLKKLPAITATAVIHQAAPEQNTVRPFCPRQPKLKRARKKFAGVYIEFLPPIENSYRVFTASPPMRLLPMLLPKPAELLLFYIGADTL